jgi:tetratricopeptide (TPR) repeat protein
MWVFWVHASNVARFEQSYRDIADCIKIYGRRDPRVNIFKLVHDWLRDCKERWLLILDNVDDARFLLDGQAHEGTTTGNQSATRPLREYIPHCECGSILVTTRNKEAALSLVEQPDILTVEPMDKSQAQALFKKKLGVQGRSSHAAELAAALEFMPLAIVQAAAYVSQRAPRFTVAKYLEEFKKSERKRTSLLNYDKHQLRRDWEAKNSIIITWQISFEHIQQTRASAADLLSLMSFFDRQGIPDTLLRTGNRQIYEQGTPQDKKEAGADSDNEGASQSSTSTDEFEEDILLLRNFSFVSVNVDGTTFEMHALVQLAMRTWLQAHNKLEPWKYRFISTLCVQFPNGRYESWTECQTLFAHAKSAAEQQPEEESSLAQWATLLYRAAWYACEIGNVVDAENFAVKSMKVRNRLLGQGHIDALPSISLVGWAYRLAGQWNAAEELDAQVMEAYKKKLGTDHLNTFNAMSRLASTYRYQGRWDAAEELEVQVLEAYKKKLGLDHPDTLTSMIHLAFTFWNQGRWDAAEQLEVEAIEISKKKLGADHPYTLTSMANLATTYWDQGRWDAAEELEVQVLEASKKKLGADHPDTIGSMANLAATFRVQGRWDAAEELDMQVVEMSKKKLGADHPDTIISIANLAATYQAQDRCDAAEELFVQVLEVSKTKLGADHPSTLSSMAQLALTWKKQGRAVQAICLLSECVQRRERVLGVNHPHFISSSAMLAEWETEEVPCN